MSEIRQLDNTRKRLEGQWQEAEQLVIDVAAAANDPNIRIYKNDAIINADRSFGRALREVYRATKVFEYYTSQSYADAEKLFLVRMVGAGDVNLQQYLLELQEAFYVFEEQYGNPDARVEVISVRDHVFQVPRYSDEGTPRVLSHEERVAKFRRQITDPALLDDNGYVVISFNTHFGMLSPLTLAHKVLFIEMELFGEASIIVWSIGITRPPSWPGGTVAENGPWRAGPVEACARRGG